MKNKIAKTIQGLVPYVPISWVLTCFDLGENWMNTNLLTGIFTVLAGTLFVRVLHLIGEIAAYGKPIEPKEPENANLWQQIKNLFILLIILIILTGWFGGASPSDVI
jgi:hypothetical protein